MMALRCLLSLALGIPTLLFGQAEYRVYNDHPRLLLDADRLKRLSRDAERQTDRWKTLRQQLDSGAAMPERAVALALSSQVTGDDSGCQQAIEVVVSAESIGPHPLRQTAFVYDWCYASLDNEIRAALARKLVDGAKGAPSTPEGARDAVLALVAASGDADGSEAVLGEVMRQSWESKLLPALQQGDLVDRGASLIALLEMSHVLRHNLDRDLWSEAPEAFRALPLARILGYLPRTIQSEEGRLRVHALAAEDPEQEAALGRIAEMLLVGYESSSRPSQFLQGWLRNDSYTLRGPLGALYEFLWINPYLPGLAPASAPKWTFDPVRSRIFAQRDGRWIGYFDGKVFVESDAGMQPAEADLQQEPLTLAGAVVVWPGDGGKWTVEVPEGADPKGPALLFVGLDAGKSVEIKVGKGDWRSFTADRAGVIVIRNNFEAQEANLEFGEPVKVQLR